MINKKILIKNIETPIELTNGFFTTIIIENNKLYYNILETLSKKDDESDLIQLFIDDNLASITELEFIYDIFTLSFNDKKNIGALSRIILKNISLNDMPAKIDKLSDEIIREFTNFLFTIDIPTQISEEISDSEFLKLINVKIKDDYQTLIERITNYLEITNKLRRIDTFIFANISMFLPIDELELLIKECNYKKIHIILLENAINRKLLSGEKRYILDNDLCLIESDML